ncbi:hypothetical protein LINGRAHAP2_LOCUS24493 [Linum grandiflorum]
MTIKVSKSLPYGFWGNEKDEMEWVSYKYERFHPPSATRVAVLTITTPAVTLRKKWSLIGTVSTQRPV